MYRYRAVPKRVTITDQTAHALAVRLADKLQFIKQGNDTEHVQWCNDLRSIVHALAVRLADLYGRKTPRSAFALRGVALKFSIKAGNACRSCVTICSGYRYTNGQRSVSFLRRYMVVYRSVAIERPSSRRSGKGFPLGEAVNKALRNLF